MNGHGDTEALKERKAIAANMTADQIAEAQRQAAVFVPSKVYFFSGSMGRVPN
jgi:hypothetical protein